MYSDTMFGVVTYVSIAVILFLVIAGIVVIYRDGQAKKDAHRRRYEETRVKPAQRR